MRILSLVSFGLGLQVLWAHAQFVAYADHAPGAGMSPKTATLTVDAIADQAAAANRPKSDSQASFAAATFTPQDLGSPALPGSIAPVSGGYNLMASGADIGGTADKCFFAYQHLAGDFDMAVRVHALDQVNTWTKAGLMVRATLDPGSPMASVLTTPSLPGTFFESRLAAGSTTPLSRSIPANHPATWLRLQRQGNVITGFGSFDGQIWTRLGSVSLALPASAYFGMALASHDPDSLARAQFRDMRAVLDGVSGPVGLAVEPLGACTRKTGLVLSEIMYRPAPRADGRIVEYIELFNSNPFFEDISGYRLGGQIDFAFPKGTILPGGGFLVVAAVPDDVQQIYGLNKVLGPYANSLKTHNGSGLVQLLDAIGSVLLEVPYSKDAPWPVAADATGHSLVLARPSFGEADPKAWAISDMIAGSPGMVDAFRPGPRRAVLINEILAAADAPGTGFIELYNHSNEPADISGCNLSDDPVAERFTIPSGTVIPSGGLVVFAENQMGFALNPAGQNIYFKDIGGVRVLDAVSFEGQSKGVSFGRSPDGASEFGRLAVKTPGAPNSGILTGDIVINEIMFKPISGDVNDTYVELYNRGITSVDIGGWRFVSGIKFTFPANTMIGPDRYLVVARNASNLISHYPNLDHNNTLGDFTGKLASGGERLALAMPQVLITTNLTGTATTNTAWITMDELTYRGGGRWGQWANGGGSSLELIDPHANHRLASNWADSDESQKSSWATIENTGKLDLGANYEPRINHFQIGILDAGECLVDNIQVLRSGPAGTNYVINPDFETGLNGWTLQGDHVQSSLEPAGFESATSLHLRCTDRIWTGANSAQGTLTTNSLASEQTAILRFNARWIRGSPEVLLRLNGNWLEATGVLPVPLNLGTPGARNSRAVSTAGPAIYQVTHFPTLPATNQSVLVTARVDDPDGVQSVVLNYRVDPATEYRAVTMNDQGLNGDALAGDGVYSATLPGRAANTVLAFYLEAIDNLSATARFPSVLDDNSPTRECLVMFGDSVPTTAFGTYHHWLSQTNVARWTSLPNLSNQPIDGTFVYGNRVVYNMQAHYSGSPYHEQFNSPVGSLCHYKWIFPDDDKFLGATSFNKIHQPGNGAGDDTTLQREQTFYWMVRQLGLPWNYRRFVAVYVNGKRRGPLMEDTQTPDGDVVQEHFPNDKDGDLFKLQPWFEFDPRGVGFNNQSWCVLNNYSTTSGARKLARYRWNFLSRRNQGGANDYTNVFNLISAANYAANSPEFITGMDSEADMEQWMRTFAASHSAGDWDHVGTQNAQNMYAYKPTQGRWTLFLWDCNILLGNSGCWSPGQNLSAFTGGDQGMAHIYGTYVYRRALWRAYKEIAQNIMDPAQVAPVVDAKYAAFVAEGITATSSAGIKSWIASARTSILSQVNTAGGNAAFTLDTADGSVSNDSQISLSGSAPVEVKSIGVNGVSYPLTWTSLTRWSLAVPLKPGVNSLSIQGYDLRGSPLGNSTGNITVSYRPAILSVGVASQDLISIQWTTQPGKTYRVQYLDDLRQPLAWTTLMDLPADGATLSATNNATGFSQRFYRIQLLTP